MTKEDAYYDFQIEVEEILRSCTVEEMFYLKDVMRRKFFLNDDICQETVSDVCRHILQINREDADTPEDALIPIIIYISSNGGDVDAGFQLVDCIENSRTPVYTVNLGYAYSMGFLISLAGHKRFTMPNAKFLMHDGSNFVYGTGTKVQDQMEFQKRVDERIREYVLQHSKLTREEYDAKLRVEWFMFAEEALEKGFVDYIVGAGSVMKDIV